MASIAGRDENVQFIFQAVRAKGQESEAFIKKVGCIKTIFWLPTQLIIQKMTQIIKNNNAI